MPHSSVWFSLTKEALAHLKVHQGETVYLTKAPDGSYRLEPDNPKFGQMSLAEQIMHDGRNILHALAR